MKSHFHFLPIQFYFSDYQSALLCFVSAFIITLVTIPPLIILLKKYCLFDRPGGRKGHTSPVPGMGGIAVMAGMIMALVLWFPFNGGVEQVSFFFSVAVLFCLGILDDLTDLSAKYKFVIQVAIALLIALSGIRITSFDGLFGIAGLTIPAQYTFTILAIVGITNAFNLIDGIDGLAGGLGFMSLVAIGFVLSISGDSHTALVAFALAGGLIAFLYFNINPARIFMGDTGSLVLGFVIAVLSIRLMQVQILIVTPAFSFTPVYVLGMVLIPVFDTIRVLALRIWKGKSPFVGDKTHIHHLLTNQGFSHGFAARLICFIHGIVLTEVYCLQDLKQEFILLILVVFMLLVTVILKNLGWFIKRPGVIHSSPAV